MAKTENTTKTKNKKGNPITRFFKAVFVHNIGLKILALILSAALWVIVTIV